ncbi:MAG: HEAT repeat domain-containing protein [Pirellulaceae bacterium]|nr:HEAT repeat domain-containing protein [Pirellulaceae bacterium]HJN08604.1 HEAT repeat domain-containing protein [Pirellulaceae bacterium]
MNRKLWHAGACIVFYLCSASLNQARAEPPLLGRGELSSRRVDIHVDGKRPIAGERSRFAVSARGDIYFTYTLAAGDFSCKPLGHIAASGEIRMSAIDSESTWNVEGWGTYGCPFDLAFDSSGGLHIATRHRGPPYGVDFWRQVDGVWRLESFGAGVTFGGNNVSLGILPNGRPVVVCLDRNRNQLALWQRSDEGQWSVSRPKTLNSVAPGQFDLVVRNDGTLQVVFCPTNGGPVCATRHADAQWTTQRISTTTVSRMIDAEVGDAGELHVSFAAGESGNSIRTLHHATQSANGHWHDRVVAQSDVERHVGWNDLSVAGGRVAIAWEHGTGRQFAPKDYGGNVGSVMLTVIDRSSESATHELVAKHGGRPGLALTPDGKTAFVGVYTGNDHGDDFYLLNCRLDDGEPLPARVVAGDPASMFRNGCLKDIDSGNAKAERRGLQRIDLSGVAADQQRTLIDRYLNHDDPTIRKAIVRELGASPGAVAHFADRLTGVLNDPDRLVRKTFLERLSTSNADQQFVRPVLVQAIGSGDPMTRLTATELVRQRSDRIPPETLAKAVEGFVTDLGKTDLSVSGSAAMALERLTDAGGTRDRLKSAIGEGSPLQRVRAALILVRCGESWSEIPACVPKEDGKLEAYSTEAQLALCGLLGQVRTADCVPLLETCLHSDVPAVRTAAVFALRSVAHVAELKPVAKHPKGFDLLALRSVAPSSAQQRETRQAAVAALVAALRHGDPNVRQKSCDALNRVMAKEALPAINELLDDPDAGVRLAARTAVATLRDHPSDALIHHGQWKQASADRSVRRIGAVQRPPTQVVDGVVQAGSDKQLLIDDFVIDEMSRLKRRLHPFEKHPRNPVFQAQMPWEEGWADPFMSTVIYDPDQRCFWMWYRCGPRHSLKGYAVSEDGVHWQRPDIAESPWQQFERHNLLGFEGRIVTWKKPGNNVLFFPGATGVDRFLSLFYQPPTSDYAVSRSADGVTWQQPESVRHAYGDVVSLVHDPGRDQFLFFPKYMRPHEGFVRRSFAATTLKELNSSFAAKLPFLAGHRDDARVADDACRAYGSLLPDTLRLPEFHSEIYSVTAIAYEGVVVALYDLWPVVGSREGPLDMPMKVSRDMQAWHDVDYPRRALSIGRFGEWDSGMVYGGNTMLVVDDQIRLYYLGANMGHCTRILPATKPYHTLGVGLATLRLDGFASLRPDGGEPGEFITKPLNTEGTRLQINARCHPGGWIKVELFDANGKAQPGYSMDDCDTFKGDSIRHTMTWRGNAEIKNVSSPVRLRVRLHNSDVFAFQFP